MKIALAVAVLIVALSAVVALAFIFNVGGSETDEQNIGQSATQQIERESTNAVAKSSQSSGSNKLLHTLIGEEYPGMIHNPDLDVLQKYYEHLGRHELEQAYNMHLSKPAPFNTFRAWYEDLEFIVPHSVSPYQESYWFYVNLKNTTQPEERYSVRMRVVGDKIETLSSKKIEADVAVSGEYKAMTKEMLGAQLLFLEKNGEENMLLDGGSLREDGNRCEFSNLQFSPKGSFLTLNQRCPTGMEFADTMITIDTDTHKSVKELECPDTYGFSPDEKYFWACYNGGFCGGPYATVLDTRDFSVVYDALEQYENWDWNKSFSCKFNARTSEIEFAFPDGKAVKFPTK